MNEKYIPEVEYLPVTRNVLKWAIVDKSHAGCHVDVVAVGVEADNLTAVELTVDAVLRHTRRA